MESSLQDQLKKIKFVKAPARPVYPIDSMKPVLGFYNPDCDCPVCEGWRETGNIEFRYDDGYYLYSGSVRIDHENCRISVSRNSGRSYPFRNCINAVSYLHPEHLRNWVDRCVMQAKCGDRVGRDVNHQSNNGYYSIRSECEHDDCTYDSACLCTECSIQYLANTAIAAPGGHSGWGRGTLVNFFESALITIERLSKYDRSILLLSEWYHAGIRDIYAIERILAGTFPDVDTSLKYFKVNLENLDHYASLRPKGIPFWPFIVAVAESDMAALKLLLTVGVEQETTFSPHRHLRGHCIDCQASDRSCDCDFTIGWRGKVGWNLRYDGSLPDSGVEYVSVPACYTELISDIDAIRSECDCGERAGLHIHVGLRRESGQQLTDNLAAKALAIIWGRFQERIYEAFDPYEQRGDEYCAPNGLNTLKNVVNNQRWNAGRYNGLNLSAFDGHGTVEFRLFNADYDPGIAMEFCVSLVARAILCAYGALRRGYASIPNRFFEFVRGCLPYRWLDFCAGSLKMPPRLIPSASNESVALTERQSREIEQIRQITDLIGPSLFFYNEDERREAQTQIRRILSILNVSSSRR